MNNSKSYSKSIAEIFMCDICDIGVPKSGRVGSGPVGSKQRSRGLKWDVILDRIKRIFKICE